MVVDLHNPAFGGIGDDFARWAEMLGPLQFLTCKKLNKTRCGRTPSLPLQLILAKVSHTALELSHGNAQPPRLVSWLESYSWRRVSRVSRETIELWLAKSKT